MLKRGNWSVEELSRLRASFARRPVEQLARDLRRSVPTVRDRAARLFAGRERAGPLDSQDLQQLRVMVGVASVAEMALVLGRCASEVLQQLRQLAAQARSGRFAAWELAYIKEYAAKRPLWALVLVTGRSQAAIERQCKRLCLGHDKSLISVDLPEIEAERIVILEAATPRAMPRWKPEDMETLRALYPFQPNLDVARILGRTVKSVRAKAQALGLKKCPQRLAAMGRENVRIRYERRKRGN